MKSLNTDRAKAAFEALTRDEKMHFLIDQLAKLEPEPEEAEKIIRHRKRLGLPTP